MANTLVQGGPHEQVPATWLRADADDAYYIDENIGALVRVPLDGGEPTEVLRNARTFALSDTAIFGITGNDLVRIAKQP